jgi:hypothetical protein
MKSEIIDPVTLEVIWNRLLSVAGIWSPAGEE